VGSGIKFRSIIFILNRLKLHFISLENILETMPGSTNVVGGKWEDEQTNII